MAPSTGKSHVACRHCDWRQRTAYRRSYWRIQRCMEALLEGATSGGDLGEREAPVMLAFSASVGFKRRWLKGRLQFTVACKICVLKVKKKVVAVERENLHGITLKGKQDENWFHLLAPIISQWNNAAQFRVDVYPRQQGLLGFNSDYMVWYRRKTKMFVDPNNANTAALGEVVETLQYMVSPQGRNTWTVDDLVPYVDKLAIISEEQERVTEPVSHGPASEREFPAPEFHILQSSVETRGLGRRREPLQEKENEAVCKKNQMKQLQE
eukprot:XP_014617195.1 uncharacterized protein LOC100803747 [Glycine max]